MGTVGLGSATLYPDMVESRGVGIREIEGVLLSTKKITSASKGGVMVESPCQRLPSVPTSRHQCKQLCLQSVVTW